MYAATLRYALAMVSALIGLVPGVRLAHLEVAPPALRVEISIHARRLWVIEGTDTLRSASIAVASGQTLRVGTRRWRFDTPRGRLLVLHKSEDPVWTPPEWHYVEIAVAQSLRVRALTTKGTRLSDGRVIALRDSVVGIEADGDSSFVALPLDEHIIFDSTVFIPPVGSRNRRIVGELGRYALDLGGGYLIHGTRDSTTIGTASTHGCIRLADDDLAWVYEHVPLGAVVWVR